MPVPLTVIMKSRIRDSRFMVIFASSASLSAPRGFTIIEILITITIISLFIGTTFAGFSHFSKRQSLISAGQTLKNILRDAQSRVFTGETDCSICDCSTGDASPVSWYADFTLRELYGKCDNNTFFHKKFEISDNIVISSQMTPNDGVQFGLPPTVVTPSGMICLSTPDLPGLYYNVQIDDSGNVSDTGAIDASCP